MKFRLTRIELRIILRNTRMNLGAADTMSPKSWVWNVNPAAVTRFQPEPKDGHR
jgi:hypothetical protein